MRARRPRTQGACGSRFLVPGSRFGTPALPACAGLRVCGRDARAPRMHVVLGSWFLVLGSGRPHSWYAQDCAHAGGTPAHPTSRRDRVHAGGTPAHPGCTWFSVPGSWFSVRDARTPGTRRIARMRARRPRTQGACGSRFLVLGSWFSVRDARAPRMHVVLRYRRDDTGLMPGGFRVIWSIVLRTLCPLIPLPPSPTRGEGGAGRPGAPLTPHPFATCSRRNCANTIRPVWV